jgi:UbiD family decarboxylase
MLFDEIPGYPKGYRVLSNAVGSPKRISLSVGFPSDLDVHGVIRSWRQKIRDLKPIPPTYVTDGPIMENVFTGSDVNMLKFPTPFWHEEDGDRFIGTACCIVTRDPDTGLVNVGTYRVAVHDENTLGLFMAPGRHGRINMMKHFERGQNCPVVMTFGQHPLLFMGSALYGPYNRSELDWAGGVRGAPVPVIAGPITGLPIPSTAEIAVEAELVPGQTHLEGPFGEFTGYYTKGRREEPCLKVQALYHRDDPIICGTPPGRPPTDSTHWQAPLRSAEIWESLERAGVSDVRGVWCHYPGAQFFIVVSIKQRFPGHAKQAGMITAHCHAGYHMGRFVVVVDDDIDPTNIGDVLWAICTRCDPQQHIDIVRRGWSSPLDPAISPEQANLNSRAIIEAVRPFERMNDFPAVAETGRELQAEVEAKWAATLGW